MSCTTSRHDREIFFLSSFEILSFFLFSQMPECSAKCVVRYMTCMLRSTFCYNSGVNQTFLILENKVTCAPVLKNCLLSLISQLPDFVDRGPKLYDICHRSHVGNSVARRQFDTSETWARPGPTGHLVHIKWSQEFPGSRGHFSSQREKRLM